MSANSDGRYAHYLKPLSDREPPKRIICVDPSSEVALGGAGGSKRTEHCTGYSAVCLRRKDRELHIVSTMRSHSAVSFWVDLQVELAYPGVLWVVSWQCSRAWALLGLWAELESRRVRVSGGDHRAVSDPDKYARSARPGLLVAEDPPMLAQLRMGAVPGQVLWLDCRNWGVELTDEHGRGQPVAIQLAELVKRLDKASAAVTGVSLSPTAASQSWRGWRAASQGVAVHCHAHPPTLKLERAGHLGGRCEAYHIGKVPHKCYHVDFRSHYGSVLNDCPLPVRLKNYTASPTDGQVSAAAERCNGIARVTLTTDEPAYAYKRDVDIIYPVGKFTTTLCGPELQDAVAKKRVYQCWELATYDVEPIASNFAARAYAGRVAADEANDRELSAWCKAIINALPGKLGYRLRCWETMPGALAPEPWGEWHQLKRGGGLSRWRALAGICQVEKVGGYGPDAVPAMAAWITAHGRYRLLQAIRAAGWGEVVYVDTDALILSPAGLSRLVSANLVRKAELGRLELRAGPVDVEIRGIKYYLEGDEVRCAGVARGVETVSPDGRGNWYTPPAGESGKIGAPAGGESTLREWPKPAPYRHGIVSAGGTVRPHVMKEVKDGR